MRGRNTQIGLSVDGKQAIDEVDKRIMRKQAH